MNTVKTGMLLAALTALFMGVGYLLGGGSGMMIAFVFGVGTNVFAYWNSDRLALRMPTTPSRGRRAHRARARTTWCTTSRAGAGLPMPRVYLIHNPQPNAFATGRNPENAAVAATTGLLAHALAATRSRA